MFRASRILLQQKPRVRPVVHNPSTKTNPQNAPPKKNLNVTPIGLAFVLGGLAFASYLFKPSNRQPTAAMDTFKPQVAIVFATGENNGQFESAANALGFDYVNVAKDFSKLDTLINQGKTRFFIEGFKNKEDLANMEENVVQPDLLLHFGNENDQPENASGQRLANITNGTGIKEALEQRNLL